MTPARLCLLLASSTAALVFAAEAFSLWALQARFSADIAEFMYAGRMVYLFGLASAGCSIFALALATNPPTDHVSRLIRWVLAALTYGVGALLLIVLPIGLFIASIR